MKLKFDKLTIILYLVLVFFGWMNIYAACYNESHAVIWDLEQQHGKQLLWIGIALVVALATLFIEPKFFAQGSYIIYGVCLLLLMATLIIGTATHGGQSWINIGPFKLQSSEFAKLGTALAVSKYMSGLDIDIKKRNVQIAVALLIAIPMGLVLLQHDTGSALVFLSFIIPLYREGLSPILFVIGGVAVVLFVLALLINQYLLMGIVLACCLFYLFVWLSKRTRRHYIRTLGIFAACCLFIFSVDFTFNHILEPHQQDRIYVLLGKTDDIKAVGYNQHQSKIAIGSGALLGKGFLKGTITKADFVPEQETDFIFCTVGEEWGFVGSTMLVVAYLVLLLRIVRLAERQYSRFSRFYGYSVASILFIHFLINIGMVLGLLPVIGIPLPFFSYGGSSLMAFTILLFVFLRQDQERTKPI